MTSSSCCTAMRGEFKSPMFDLDEPRPSGLRCFCSKKDADNKGLDSDGTDENEAPLPRLDVVRTFSPSPRPLYIFGKLFCLAWIVSIMYVSISTQRYPSFWLAYLTHWCLCASVAYAIASVVSAVYLAWRPPVDPSVLEGRIGVLLKATWTLFALAVPSQVMAAFLYWAVEYDGRALEYKTVMTHGGVMVLNMIDGYVLSRIPIRMKQIVFFLIYGVMYIIWTVVQSYSGIVNPYYVDGSRDNNAIYDALNWKGNLSGAAIMSVLVVFVYVPLIGLFCRALSRSLPRRVCEVQGDRTFRQEQEKNQDISASGIEMVGGGDEEAGNAVVY